MSGLGAVIRSWEDEGGVTDPKQFLGNKNHDFFRCSGPGAKNGLSAKNRLATSTILLMAFGSLGVCLFLCLLVRWFVGSLLCLCLLLLLLLFWFVCLCFCLLVVEGTLFTLV